MATTWLCIQPCCSKDMPRGNPLQRHTDRCFMPRRLHSSPLTLSTSVMVLRLGLSCPASVCAGQSRKEGGVAGCVLDGRGHAARSARRGENPQA